MKKEENKKNGTIEKMKRPKFIVFTDKDGTLNLEDKELSNILKQISALGGMVIPITGRTVGDIKEDFKARKIALPKIIIGDNGANIYSTASNEFIIKKTLEVEKVKKIIEYFKKIGGDVDLIRYTDGSNIYASEEKNVKKYYNNSKTAKLSEDMYDRIMNSEEITKITLAGSKEQMEKISKFAGNLKFWTDMDKTKFPERSQGNYRLDIADKNINKGEAVKAIAKLFKPEYGYICVGNGYNDLSMFKQAIDDGMTAAIMNDSDIELINEVHRYVEKTNTVRRQKGKTVVIPKDKNKANRWIFRMAKIMQNRIREDQLKGVDNKRNTKRLANVPRVSGVKAKVSKNKPKKIPLNGEDKIK